MDADIPEPEVKHETPVVAQQPKPIQKKAKQLKQVTEEPTSYQIETTVADENMFKSIVGSAPVEEEKPAPVPVMAEKKKPQVVVKHDAQGRRVVQQRADKSSGGAYSIETSDLDEDVPVLDEATQNAMDKEAQELN